MRRSSRVAAADGQSAFDGSGAWRPGAAVAAPLSAIQNTSADAIGAPARAAAPALVRRCIHARQLPHGAAGRIASGPSTGAETGQDNGGRYAVAGALVRTSKIPRRLIREPCVGAGQVSGR